MIRLMTMVLAGIAITGCSTLPQRANTPSQPETPICELCAVGKYHAAMRTLPRAMQQWAEYTKRTGETAEGMAGHQYSTTMMAISERGDADWGKILDDPEIPYEYKAEMVFEILEARLGKGAVYVGNKDNFIVPRHRPADLDKEMIKLPDKQDTTSRRTIPLTAARTRLQASGEPCYRDLCHQRIARWGGVMFATSKRKDRETANRVVEI
jgi:hypothetical protein